jgi:hypothetical protein
MNTQISITKIENGWLVATPPSQRMIETAQRSGQQPAGEITYAQDYEHMCTILAKLMGKD